MLNIEKTETYGWDAAIRGMRNPKNSWDKSDTGWVDEYSEDCIDYDSETGMHKVIGENDLHLMKTLAHAGNDHGKFLRMITVTCDITAPLYWWKEFDTYKVGTVADSCSTMHKIQAKEFVREDFSIDHLYVENVQLMDFVIRSLNVARDRFNESQDKEHWWQMIQLLPTSYNQKRTVQMNYAVLKNMYHARKNHKLDEWHTLCDWIESLPYSVLITE